MIEFILKYTVAIWVFAILLIVFLIYTEEFFKGLYNKLSKKYDPIYHSLYGPVEPGTNEKFWKHIPRHEPLHGINCRCEVRSNHLGIFFYPKDLIQKVISKSGMEDVYKLSREMRKYLGIKEVSVGYRAEWLKRDTYLHKIKGASFPVDKELIEEMKQYRHNKTSFGTLKRDSSYNTMSRGVPTQFK